MNLERLRKKQKLTRIELAEILGCHKQQIFNFEKGTSTIPLKYTTKLAEALKISQKELTEFIVKSKVERLMKEVK